MIRDRLGASEDDSAVSTDPEDMDLPLDDYNEYNDDFAEEEDEAHEDGAGEGEPAGEELDGPQMVEDDYEPSEQEVMEYCEWIGLDPNAERQLIWIAREALKAPLPENWKVCYTDEREIYYFNVRTGESIWDHPMDAYYIALFKQEKAKLDQKKRSMRFFSGSMPILPLADFFSDVAAGILGNDGKDDDADQPWKQIPDTLIDAIDFRLFVQAVVLPTTGRTVSRRTIISNRWRDPFSREYIENRRLVPNVDKRSEVDAWLLTNTSLYLDSLTPSPAGIARLLNILPYLLDKEEEVCVRSQGKLLLWFQKHLRPAKVAVTLVVKEETEHPPPEHIPSARSHRNECVEKNSARASKSRGTPRESTARRASLTKKQQPCSSSSSSIIVAKTTPPPTPPTAEKSPTIVDHLNALCEADMNTLVGSLLTMSTSSSRELLLLLVSTIPRCIVHPAFKGYSDEVLNVLQLSTLDLSRIAAGIISRTAISEFECLQSSASELLMADATGAQSGSTVRSHFAVTNHDHLISLRWVLLLAGSPPTVNALHKLDFVAALHIIFAIRASADLGASANTLSGLLRGTDGWPSRLSSCSDDHIRWLLEIAREDASALSQVTLLHDIATAGGERGLSVLSQSSKTILASLIEVARIDLARNAQTSSVDLLAAILVFHEILRISDFSSTPQIALRIAYNLGSRLTRSQWRPKYFHETITAIVALVDANSLAAWSVMGSRSVLFFTRELSRKKNGSDEVRAKLESIEASERQLQQSSAITNWEILTARLGSRQSPGAPSTPPTSNPRGNQKAAVDVSSVKLPQLGPSRRQSTLSSSSSVATEPGLPQVKPSSANVRQTQRCPVISEETLRLRKNDILVQRAKNISSALCTLLSMRLKAKQRGEALATRKSRYDKVAPSSSSGATTVQHESNAPLPSSSSFTLGSSATLGSTLSLASTSSLSLPRI